MTIPLIQRPGPFQQLQQAVQGMMEQRQQRQAQQLAQMTGQANLENTQARTAGTQSDTNRAQQAYEKAQQREQEVTQALDLVSNLEEGTPEYQRATTAALSTLRTPEQIAAYNTGIDQRRQARLTQRRQNRYGKLMETPTLTNLTQALGLAIQDNDKELIERFGQALNAHAYAEDPNDPMRKAQIDAEIALAEQRRASGNLSDARRGWGPNRGARPASSDARRREITRRMTELRETRNAWGTVQSGVFNNMEDVRRTLEEEYGPEDVQQALGNRGRPSSRGASEQQRAWDALPGTVAEKTRAVGPRP